MRRRSPRSPQPDETVTSAATEEWPPATGPGAQVPKGWDLGRAPAWLPRALTQAVVAVFAGILAWRALASLGTVITILVISWFVALALEPAIARLVRRGLKRGLATGLVMLASVLVVVAVLGLFGGLFVAQLVALVRAVPQFYADLTEMFDDRFGLALPPVDDLLDAAVDRWDDLAPGLLGVGTSLAGGLFTATAVLLVVYYMAAAGSSFRVAICRLLAPNRQREVLRVWEVSQEMVSGFILSRLVLAAASTLATWAFLEILRIPYALPMAAFTGVVSQFVPTVGTYLGGALPVVVALSQSPLKAVGVVVFIVVYQQVENLLLSPKVSQHSLQLNPAVAFLSVIGFGAVFGPLGAFLSLPATAVIQAVSSTYWRRHELVDSDLLREPAAPPARA